MTSEAKKDVPNGRPASGGDVISDVIGDDGPWQRRIFLVMFFCAIPSATHNLAMAFLAPNLEHWCARPAGSNVSVEVWKSNALPPSGGECFRYRRYNLSSESNASRDDGDDELVACTSWEYDESFYTATVLSQWDLVCEREWLVSLSKSVYMAGFLVSVFVFGHLADRLGRRPIVATCAAIAVCSAVICAFSTSFVMFAAARFFVAIGISGLFTTGFVLLMEVVGPDLRSVYGIAVEFGWCLGFVCLPAIVWLLRDWFWIQLALTGPCLALLFIWWCLPESPRWLLSQGRTEEAQKVLLQAAERNGKKVEDVEAAFGKISTKNIVEEDEATKGTVLDLLRTPGLWQKTLNLYFVWFVNAFVYYGLSYNTNELAGDPFVNFAVSGAVEFPAYVACIFVIRSLGRRNPLAAAMIVGGAACLLTLPLPADPWWLVVAVSQTGKFCITCSFAVAFVYTAEIFPTVVRNVGLGTASLCARIGSIIAPFVRELGHATHPVLPLLVFGVLSVLGGLMVLLLPETHHCTVPDTLEEAALRGRKPRSAKSEKPSQNGHVPDSGPEEAPQDATPPAPAPTTVTTTPPLSKPRENGKKLADVPEEDVSVQDPEGGQEMTVLPPECPVIEPEEPPVEVENVAIEKVGMEDTTVGEDVSGSPAEQDGAQSQKTTL